MCVCVCVCVARVGVCCACMCVASVCVHACVCVCEREREEINTKEFRVVIKSWLVHWLLHHKLLGVITHHTYRDPLSIH